MECVCARCGIRHCLRRATITVCFGLLTTTRTTTKLPAVRTASVVDGENVYPYLAYFTNIPNIAAQETVRRGCCRPKLS